MPSRLLKSVLCWCLGCLLAMASQLALAQAQAPTETFLDVPIVDGALPKALRLIKARQGEQLHWRISSNTAGELHLHAYRLSVTLQAGQTTELSFAAFATGRFRLEWHSAGDKRSATDAHHAPPLATLEVRPK
jgi:hypothetical protein